MPPTVARLADDTSGANRRWCGRSAAFSSSSTTPGSTRAHLLVGIDLENPVEMLRGVEHQAGADRLPGLRRAAASRRDRHAVSRGDPDRAHHRFGRARNDDAERLDLVDAGVGRVQRARHLVEANFAVDRGFELALQILRIM